MFQIFLSSKSHSLISLAFNSSCIVLAFLVLSCCFFAMSAQKDTASDKSGNVGFVQVDSKGTMDEEDDDVDPVVCAQASMIRHFCESIESDCVANF